MTIKETLIKGIEILNKNKIEDSNLISKMLLSDIIACKKEELFINFDKEIHKIREEEFINNIYRIAKGYPIQYLIGKKEFMKMEFLVNEDVLIPRADTEVLVEEVLKFCKNKKNILDLCTGSGVIAISLAKYADGLNITATDISEEALKIAKVNEKELLTCSKINFIKSDMFENINDRFDIIVSNPPYIKTNVIKDYNLKYEPKLALDRRGRWA